jgi:wyosine [tRNA(Phe)-imidazoG37] synthetase (radical SAM superfamily)
VLSRRLGRSLGVDLVPFKTCTYDCIYCQLGRTTHKTVERKEYVPLGEVLAELDRALQAGSAPDTITLSGSGEPTLHCGLAPLIRGIKQRTSLPIAVLTNGSLLWSPEVQESLLEADLVIPSLDAGDETLFQRVNRPHAAVAFERMLAGLELFRRRFAKPIWLEVLLLRGLTGTTSQLRKIRRLVARINPDRVQLNTASRPPSEAVAAALSPEELQWATESLGPRADIIPGRRGARRHQRPWAGRADIVNLLRRRPCALEDVAEGLGLHPGEVAKHLAELVRRRVLVCDRQGAKTFYRFAGEMTDRSCAGGNTTGPAHQQDARRTRGRV